MESYPRYGGRGISVCERWKKSFENFLADIGFAPSSKHSLERKDVNGNYEPNNVCWETAKVQARNRRNSRSLSFNGRTATVAEWGDVTGISQDTLLMRLKRGWTIEKTLTTPLRIWH